MATSISLVFLLSIFSLFSASQSVDFIYNGFNEEDLTLFGDTRILKHSGTLGLTTISHGVTGQAFHPKPIPMFDTNSSSPPHASSYSFSTSFVFAIIPQAVNQGGYGLAFILSPSMQFPGAQGEHYLGVLNESNDGNSSNHIFMVEFDTVSGFQRERDREGNHIGININSMNSIKSAPAYYFSNDSNNEQEAMILESGNQIQAWIDYDGMKKVLNVTISPLSVPKPIKPLISKPIDLSRVFKDIMYAGFSAATGEKASCHYLLGWSFRLNGTANPLDPSLLPQPPYERKSSSLKPKIRNALIATAAIVLFSSMTILFVVVFKYRPKMQFEALEDWELDCPHRFRYKDLYSATKGFKDTELIGVGGFGAVYKGVLPTTGVEIAVKRITNNSVGGMREFAAEIESLGRLRHKNLVNLQGWCKKKNDLHLVYDYVRNGSLDSLLFKTKNDFVLSWEYRFNILKGIAEGLLYLHEEWEQVVIHRDVKSSNVLIDDYMNGRLGDFGLARLYNHEKNSHTTKVVGTVGYIAPELIQTGKASTSSDVYAYGVLLLEVACGRQPIVYEQESGHVILMDWVIDCLRNGQIINAVDPKLESAYVVEEAELVLGLGIICSHPRLEERPTMRQVIRYLNGDETFLIYDRLSSIESRQAENISRFSRFLSIDKTTHSYQSSFIGHMSSSSLDNGR